MLRRSTPVSRPRTSAPRQQARSYAESAWASIPVQGLDNIKALTAMYQKDTAPNKVLLGEGVYRTNEGKPWVLPSVREAEKIVYDSHPGHEYAPVPGVAAFIAASQRFAFGEDNAALKENRIASVQAISGTGALRVGAEFLKRFVPEGTKVFYPDPTWVNHIPIFGNAGLELGKYRYFDPKTNGLDFEGCVADLKAAPNKSVILLHACAHNPTGVDPTLDQWKALSKVCEEKQHIVFFDNAYQGFASGDPTLDAKAFRTFIEDGHTPIVTQSYAKNFGLYGERVGALNVVCSNPKEAEAVSSQLAVIIRAMYSNPPLYGARLVTSILENKALTAQWQQDVKEMAGRIKNMRSALVEELHKAGSQKDWSHITNQIGMFAFSGLNPQQVDALREKHHVYMTKDGRISIAGINTNNLEYLGKTIHDVTK